jgi:hypothetical protein
MAAAGRQSDLVSPTQIRASGGIRGRHPLASGPVIPRTDDASLGRSRTTPPRCVGAFARPATPHVDRVDVSGQDRRPGPLQRNQQIGLRIPDQVLHDPLGLRIGGLAPVRTEPVMAGEPDVLGGGHHLVRDAAALQAAHPVGQDHLGHPPCSSKHSASNPSVVSARSSAANRTNRTRDQASTAQNTCTGRRCPDRSPASVPATTPPGGARGDARPATPSSPPTPTGESSAPTRHTGPPGRRQEPVPCQTPARSLAGRPPRTIMRVGDTR